MTIIKTPFFIYYWLCIRIICIFLSQIKVSNGVLNSSVVASHNVVSWPLVPAPEVQQVTNMSATLLVELGAEHSFVTSLYIEVTF